MALILDHFYSAALTECNSLTAIVPMENNEKSSYPVLWLLPPAGCDHTAWQRHTAVEDLADELGIIIVMPGHLKDLCPGKEPACSFFAVGKSGD